MQFFVILFYFTKRKTCHSTTHTTQDTGTPHTTGTPPTMTGEVTTPIQATGIHTWTPHTTDPPPTIAHTWIHHIDTQDTMTTHHTTVVTAHT